MSLSALAAPLVAVGGLLIGMWNHSQSLTPAITVLLGYLAGLLESRFDIGIEKEQSK